MRIPVLFRDSLSLNPGSSTQSTAPGPPVFFTLSRRDSLRSFTRFQPSKQQLPSNSPILCGECSSVPPLLVPHLLHIQPREFVLSSSTLFPPPFPVLSMCLTLLSLFDGRPSAQYRMFTPWSLKVFLRTTFFFRSSMAGLLSLFFKIYTPVVSPSFPLTVLSFPSWPNSDSTSPRPEPRARSAPFFASRYSPSLAIPETCSSPFPEAPILCNLQPTKSWESIAGFPPQHCRDPFSPFLSCLLRTTHARMTPPQVQLYLSASSGLSYRQTLCPIPKNERLVLFPYTSTPLYPISLFLFSARKIFSSTVPPSSARFPFPRTLRPDHSPFFHRYLLPPKVRIQILPFQI